MVPEEAVNYLYLNPQVQEELGRFIEDAYGSQQSVDTRLLRTVLEAHYHWLETRGYKVVDLHPELEPSAYPRPPLPYDPGFLIPSPIHG